MLCMTEKDKQLIALVIGLPVVFAIVYLWLK